MPAIKAYKFKDNIVPVDSAKVVKAYQCPWTGRIVETKRTYVKHLKELRESRMHARIRHARIQRMLDELSRQPDWRSVIDFVERNSHWFLARAKRSAGSHYEKHPWPDPEDFWIRITYLNIRHSDCLSNSHSCPRGGVTNWSKVSGRPTGYPGWGGRIEYQFSHDLPGFSSDIMHSTGIHTGTGGGTRDNRFGYDVRLFDADWPMIAEPLERDRVLKVLRDDSYSEPSFTYGTPYYFR